MDLLGHFAACGVCDLARSWPGVGNMPSGIYFPFRMTQEKAPWTTLEWKKAQPTLTLMPAALRVPALCPGSLSLGSESATGVLSLCTLPTHVPLAAPCRAAGADSLWVSCMAPMVHRAAAGPHGV